MLSLFLRQKLHNHFCISLFQNIIGTKTQFGGRWGMQKKELQKDNTQLDTGQNSFLSQTWRCVYQNSVYLKCEPNGSPLSMVPNDFGGDASIWKTLVFLEFPKFMRALQSETLSGILKQRWQPLRFRRSCFGTEPFGNTVLVSFPSLWNNPSAKNLGVNSCRKDTVESQMLGTPSEIPYRNSTGNQHIVEQNQFYT